LNQRSENDIDLEMVELEEARSIIMNGGDYDAIKRLNADLARLIISKDDGDGLCLSFDSLTNLDETTALELVKRENEGDLYFD
jgi:hypothetical protein